MAYRQHHPHWSSRRQIGIPRWRPGSIGSVIKRSIRGIHRQDRWGYATESDSVYLEKGWVAARHSWETKTSSSSATRITRVDRLEDFGGSFFHRVYRPQPAKEANKPPRILAIRGSAGSIFFLASIVSGVFAAPAHSQSHREETLKNEPGRPGLPLRRLGGN